MFRLAITELQQWKEKKGRKPLIIRGARQVGKTYLLQEFGSKFFPKYHYINFEKNQRARKIFVEDLDPKRIISELEIILDKTIDPLHDLLIFDEIQDCPNALTSLKYFQEDIPHMAVIGAGSLLGVRLQGVSFPVGKVDFLNMYPMNFHEFLMALEEKKALAILAKTNENSTLPEVLHDHLWQRFKWYLVVGGLPEVVKTFLSKKEKLFEAFASVRSTQQFLINSYLADMSKHAGKVNALHLERLWHSIPDQLAQSDNESTKRFKFKEAVPGINRYSDLVGVIDWLEAAGLIIKVKIAHSAKLPLSAFTKENIFKLFVFDIGILGALSQLLPQTILDQNFGCYKGYIAENFVAQEFIAKGALSLYSWEEKTAEIEFLRDIQGKIIPVEVKSGLQTKAKSLSIFCEKYQPPYAIIFSGKNMHTPRDAIRRYLPLYLTSWFPFNSPTS